MGFATLDRIGTLPAPFDSTRARVGRDHWLAAAGHAPRAGALIREPAGEALVAAVCGNSPHLARCLARHPTVVLDWAEEGTRSGIDAALAGLDSTTRDETALLAGLRAARAQVSLVVALADICGLWALDEVTGALSRFAERAIEAALAHLLLRAREAGLIEDSDPAASGVIVLGVGKLGGRELNYSSDVDLIVLWDAERLRCPGGGEQRFCVRLVRDLVRLLGLRTADGYALRTDLRLRPDPAATPPALSVDAAELYYESLGQNWERAALIKARPVAGDLAAGHAVLDRLRPFVWRRHLDFAAIQDIHSIKRQIHARKGGATTAVAGHNIKLGRGGIREIEFFAQTLQLIFGGREPALRQRATCDALAALARARRIDGTTADALVDAYGRLRRIEHRLQMIDDRQTHTIPADASGLAHVATFLGFDRSDSFADHLGGLLRRVEGHYADLFEDSAPLSAAAGESLGNLVFTGSENDPDTLATLARMGFGDTAAVARAVRGWHHGRVRPMRSARAREILTELMPRLLGAFAATSQPDGALMRFNEFLERLPAGVQLFSLFQSNAHLLDLVAEIMGTAPRLAERLARNPALLDHVLSIDFLEPLGPTSSLAAELEEHLAGADHVEDLYDRVRRWTLDREFQLGVQLLRGLSAPNAAARRLSRLTDAVLLRLLPRVAEAFAARHGRVAGGETAVLAFGKYGARELDFGSDLDLVFVYRHDRDAVDSDGPKALPASLYFTRLDRRIVAALTARTNAGPLFEIDMRLRPSGAAGPLASELGGYLRYQEEEAWMWEHMALTKLRVVWATGGLAGAVTEGVGRILRRRRDPARVADAVVGMRRRIAREHPPRDRFDVKYARGGLIDLDFTVRALQLAHAADSPSVLAAGTAESLAACAASGLIDADDRARLSGAARLMRDVQSVIRLAVSGRASESELPPPLMGLLTRVTGSADVDTLRRRLDDAQHIVRDAFSRHVAAPARVGSAEITGIDAGAA